MLIKKKFKGIVSLGIIVTFFILGCTNKILYHPPKVERKLSDAFFHKALDINTTDGIVLSSVLYRSPSTIQNKGTILFLHGNADNITTLPKSLLLFPKRGYDLLLLDYRGYGKSTGSPSPKGLSIDMNSTINYLTNMTDNIYIYAQSIGGTSLLGTLDNIDKSKIRAIVTEGSFLSYKELSKSMGISIPFTDYEELKLYAPISSDDKITIPLMLIHSENDEIIPYSQGLALSKHFIYSKHVKTVGRHLGYLSSISSFKNVFDFFEKNKNYQFIPPIKPIISNVENNSSDKNITKGVNSE